LISFSNEIANLSAELGVDAVEVMHGVHLDKRFMPILADGTRVSPGAISYLAAGCGFGGSCFPKDVKALIAHGVARGFSMELLRSVIAVNQAQPARMIEMLKARLGALHGRKVTVLGMAFKPGTDDIRESPSLSVTRALLDAGAVVSAFDPVAKHEAQIVFGADVRFDDTLEGAIAGADGVLIMTAWPQFQSLPQILSGLDNPPHLIDGRRILAPDSVASYAGIGLKLDEVALIKEPAR
jgi:UDPglucose 6-dehydrogenase/GDP-mannose 6-dehydrogenase